MLWSKRKDYIRVLISGMFIIAMVYFSTAMGAALVYISAGEQSDMTSLIMEVEKKFILPYFLLIILMLIILINYIRKRSPDYELLTILGIKKKHRYSFILVEYLGIVIGSIGGGLCIGDIIAGIGTNILGNIFNNTIKKIHYGWTPVKLCLIVSLIIFLFGFIICDQLISCMGIDYVIAMGNKSGRSIKQSKFLFSLGGIAVFAAFITNITYWGKVGNIVPMIFMLIAMLLIMNFGLAQYLIRLRGRNKYYKKILFLNDWYHWFYYHVNVTFIVTAFIIMMILGFNISLLDNIPVVQKENYPYDLVWSANRRDLKFLNSLKEKYNVEIQCIPSMRVTSADYGEHTGISEATYTKLTNKKLNLKNKEIYIIYQRDRSEYGTLEIDYGKKRPRLYLGASDYDIWVYTGYNVLPSNKFKRNYTIVGKENNIITGNFKQRVLSDSMMKTDVFENFIVFSNQEYKKMHNKARGANLTVLMNISGNYKKIIKEIYTYAKKNSQINFWDYKGGNVIYERKQISYVDKENKTLTVCAAIINMCTLFLCGIFTLTNKLSSDYETLKWKYIFLSRSGISIKKKKKYIYKEVMLSVQIVAVAAMPFSFAMMLEKIIYEQLPVQWIKFYILEMIVLIVGVCLLLFGIILFIAKKITIKIGRSE